MRTKILITALFIAVFTAFGMAQKPTPEKTKCNVDVQLTSENLIVVRYQNANDDKIRIKVYDENKEFVNGRTLKATGNIKVSFDMSDLAEGNYYFKVFKNNKVLCTEEVTKLSTNNMGIPQRIKNLNTVNQAYYTQR
ncbi:MAG: hypothetical protein PF517_07425 [Salinivirgaceae bacterium]|jgi:uncharacterized protein (DUF2141 family)|nr:hypothetical protein [Salinivirgaceae bacterium]